MTTTKKAKTLVSALAVALLTTAAATPAAQAPEPLVWVGMGNISCGKWLDARTGRPTQTDAALLEVGVTGWVQGFLFAQNMPPAAADAEQVFKRLRILPEVPTLHAYLDKYCRDHPLTPVWPGAVALQGELAQKGAAK